MVKVESALKKQLQNKSYKIWTEYVTDMLELSVMLVFYLESSWFFHYSKKQKPDSLLMSNSKYNTVNLVEALMLIRKGNSTVKVKTNIYAFMYCRHKFKGNFRRRADTQRPEKAWCLDSDPSDCFSPRAWL